LKGNALWASGKSMENRRRTCRQKDKAMRAEQKNRDHSIFRYRRIAWAAVLVFGASVISTESSAAEEVAALNTKRRAADAKIAEPLEDNVQQTQEVKVASAEQPDKRSAPQAIEFNPSFFFGKVADLSRYTYGNPVTPGVYPLDLTVNGRRHGRFDIEFMAVPGSNIAEPCFNLNTLIKLGVDRQRLAHHLAGDGGGAAVPSADICIPLKTALPDAGSYFDSAELKLDLEIPQIEMSKKSKGYVDPSLWDTGINAGLVQYNLSGYTSGQNFGGSRSNSLYLGLQSGLNIGPWRFRQRSAMSWANRGVGKSWQSQEIYAQRDITALRSQFKIGDSYTNGEVFDSFSVRGIQLSSDDLMLPDSMRSYAPIIRGVAETNARVIVRQNNNTLYEVSVPPGPFEFNDIPATGYGGDLDVTVVEADGRSKEFSVPFAAVSQLLRPGMHRFNISAGRYRDRGLNSEPWIMQATYQRGLSNLVTAYGGILTSLGYESALLGTALNTRVGAISVI